MDTPAIEEILDVWLGPGETPSAEKRKTWFQKDPAFDAMLRERFGPLLERACAGELDGWTETPRGTLALVILLDQLSRNIHRDTPRAFAQDLRARQIAEEALARGVDAELPWAHRFFLLMPLMHAEDLGAQDECIRRSERYAAEAPEEHREAFTSTADYGRRHRVIIERFGRFPHRNAVLGRVCTDEEHAFLAQPGSSF